MKRMLLIILITVISLCSLAGCGGGKEVNVSCSGEAILFDGKASKLTEWCGETATHKVGDALSISYYICTGGPDDCPHNTVGVLPENMGKKKKARYYSVYFDTYVYMLYPCGDYWIEGCGVLEDEDKYSTQQILDYMHADMEGITLTADLNSMVYADAVTVDLSSWEYKVRPGEIVIPGVLRVKMNDDSVRMTGSKTFGNITVTTASTASYDYYKYKNVLIQMAAGIDVEAYIQFLE